MQRGVDSENQRWILSLTFPRIVVFHCRRAYRSGAAACSQRYKQCGERKINCPVLTVSDVCNLHLHSPVERFMAAPFLLRMGSGILGIANRNFPPGTLPTERGGRMCSTSPRGRLYIA